MAGLHLGCDDGGDADAIPDDNCQVKVKDLSGSPTTLLAYAICTRAARSRRASCAVRAPSPPRAGASANGRTHNVRTDVLGAGGIVLDRRLPACRLRAV